MRIRGTIYITFLFTLFYYHSFAQEKETANELITDRPDQTEAPSVVPKGNLQIETGFAYEESGNTTKINTTTFNTTLLRYGILDNWELRIGWNFLETEFVTNGQRLSNLMSGLSPLLIGTKINITKEKGLLPEIGLLGHIYPPFAAATDYKTETTGVDFRFSFAHTLDEKSSLSYNLGAAWGDDSSEASYIYTLSYGYGITKTLGVYAELYGDFPENNSANHLWDAGVTYLIKSNIQFDATVGSGITEGQNLLLSAGVSLRLPN